MTKKLFIVCAALVWTVALVAQNIAVVSPEGETSLYKTLKEAINGATPESVIYLPGGVFEGNDTITKKLTIFGIGHKGNTDNTDGITYISGSLYFYPGSDGSALMGCYVTNAVIIGSCKRVGSGYDYESTGDVNNILIRYNRMSYLSFGCKSSGTVVNQNFVSESIAAPYLYKDSHLASITNNVVGYINFINDSNISNNIAFAPNPYYGHLYHCLRSGRRNNIVMGTLATYNDGGYISDNMTTSEYGENCINVSGEDFDWTNVFVKYDKSNPLNSDFHFKGDYTQYNGQVGIYAGDGFSDKQLAPVPYIVAKHVDEQTDAQGKLSIKVRVKAGDSE